MSDDDEAIDRTRLISGAVVAGYRWDTREGSFYSTDGQSWSGTPIEAEFTEHHTGLKDRSGTDLYWGDIVLNIDPQTKKQEYLTVLGGRNDVLIANLRTQAIERLNLLSPMSRRLGTKIGRIGDWSLPPSIRNQLTTLAEVPPTLPTKAYLGSLMSLLIGTAVVSYMQWMFFDSIGPMATTLGACAAQGIFLGVSHKRSRWLSRKRLLRLAGATLALLAVAGFAASLVLVADWTMRYGLTYAFCGAVLGGTITMLSGDMISWLLGGYSGELPKGKWNRLYMK